jgi:hypothetical protein
MEGGDSPRIEEEKGQTANVLEKSQDAIRIDDEPQGKSNI